MSSRFVSATEIEEAEKRREEEWKKAYERLGQEPPKKPDNVPYDGRSLYERLKENEDKKQAEFEEKTKLKNLYRRLDEDEVTFLDDVMEEKAEIERQKKEEMENELKQFREAQNKTLVPVVDPAAGNSTPQKPKEALKKTKKQDKLKKSLVGVVVKKKVPQESKKDKN